MGLGDLVIPKPNFKAYESNEITGGSENVNIVPKLNEPDHSTPWWYIGD